jgi:hypothetical protein
LNSARSSSFGAPAGARPWRAVESGNVTGRPAGFTLFGKIPISFPGLAPEFNKHCCGNTN